MVAVFTLPAGEDPSNARSLREIYPEPAHRVVHAGEDLHRSVARIIPHKLFVDLKYSFKFAIECRAIDVSEIQIDHGLAVDAEPMLINHFMDGASGDIARH